MRAATAATTTAVAAVLAAAVVASCGAGGGGPRVERVTVASKAVHRRLHLTVVVPSGGGDGRGLLVFLHGRGGDDRTSVRKPFLSALKRLGDEAPVVAFPDGGDHSYWHDRRSGAWRRYVVDEVIPRAVAMSGADARRVAIGGISMGGFGAYDIARRSPSRFCAAGGHSPAIWTTSGQTAPGAFDDAADFARHDVVAAARRGRFKQLPLWLDAGRSDPFVPGDRAFAAAAQRGRAHLTVRSWPGGHTGAYWDAHWRSYLRFYVNALADCHPAQAGGHSIRDAAFGTPLTRAVMQP